MIDSKLARIESIRDWITVAEALTQAAMHSQWHRGQNAVRLRELGVEPPPVDLIVWYWKGRPAAAWTL